jgi:hypothetical protein
VNPSSANPAKNWNSVIRFLNKAGSGFRVIFGRSAMTPKNVFAVVLCALPLALSGPSVADEYKAGEFFGRDLSTAVLSPKPLGPPQQFTLAPAGAGVDRDSGQAQARVEPEAAAASVAPKEPAEPRVAHLRAERPHRAARTRLAHRHGNPLDAQAFDTRIQVWPCRSSGGGICDWKR